MYWVYNITRIARYGQLTPHDFMRIIGFSLSVPETLSLDQGWATPNTRAELGTRALLSGTWARPRKRDPPPFKVSVSSFSFVNNPLFNSTPHVLLMPNGYKQSRINRTPYPPIGGGTLPQGPKIQTPHHKFWLARGRICHWFSRFRHANRKRLPAPGLDASYLLCLDDWFVHTALRCFV